MRNWWIANLILVVAVALVATSLGPAQARHFMGDGAFAFWEWIGQFASVPPFLEKILIVWLVIGVIAFFILAILGGVFQGKSFHGFDVQNVCMVLIFIGLAPIFLEPISKLFLGVDRL
jgi:hypothetical protein